MKQKLVDSSDVAFELQEQVNAIKTRIQQHEKTLVDIQRITEEIEEYKSKVLERKKLFVFSIDQRFHVKETLLPFKANERLRKLLDPILEAIQREKEEKENAQSEPAEEKSDKNKK